MTLEVTADIIEQIEIQVLEEIYDISVPKHAYSSTFASSHHVMGQAFPYQY
jgi:hypothetical protein